MESKRLARFIAYVLGRRPDEFGLVPDRDGFVNFKEFLKAVNEENGLRHIRKSHLETLNCLVSSPVFERKKHLIRACSLQNLPERKIADTLPKLLFTCVRQRAYARIAVRGILPANDKEVILSSEKTMVKRMGRRMDPKAVLLTVHTAVSEQEGVLFQLVGKGLYAAKFLPVNCFSGPPLPKETKIKETAKSPKRPKQPGSFTLDLEQFTRPDAVSSENHKTQDKKERKRKRKREPPPWRRSHSDMD